MTDYGETLMQMRRREEAKRRENAAKMGRRFEADVAAVFRLLGARVEHDISLAGNQVDILVTERTPSGSDVRTAVECKAYSKPVGVDVVNSFAAVYFLLKSRGLVDRALIVSSNGFTRPARAAGDAHSVDLLEMADLQQRVKGQEKEYRQAAKDVAKAISTTGLSRDRPKRLFAVMPFTKEFDDVYILGIREVAEKLGLVVERADDIEHNEQILDVIHDRIWKTDIVVADTTSQNPNVFYEVGYAHASGTATILISRAGEDIPFDLKTVNHIFYETIVDLRDRLTKRIRAVLRRDGTDDESP